MRNVIPPHVKCFYVRQSQPLGLGHAVLSAAELIGDEPFAVLLPDDLIDGAPKGAMAQMADVHRKTGKAVLAVEEVPLSEVHKYAVTKPADPDVYPLAIEGIVEKPKLEEAPSNLSVVGRYILTPDVMEALKTQTPGAGGEIQLTDAIARCLYSGYFLGHTVYEKIFDCGRKKEFLNSNIHFEILHNLFN